MVVLCFAVMFVPMITAIAALFNLLVAVTELQILKTSNAMVAT
jgi:hypothetical protein